MCASILFVRNNKTPINVLILCVHIYGYITKILTPHKHNHICACSIFHKHKYKICMWGCVDVSIHKLTQHMNPHAYRERVSEREKIELYTKTKHRVG